MVGDPERYPLAPGRGYDPPRASLDDYLALLDAQGIDRGVLVQPSVYGFDNACLLDAVQRAEGRLRGVAVPAPDAGPRDLEELHRRGIRGVRCNLLNPGGLAPDVVLGWQPVLADLGWHVELHVDVEAIEDLRSSVGRFRVQVVVDHMGRPGAAEGSAARHAADPGVPGGFRELVKLVAEGACFVKLSAPYRLSSGTAPWPDVTPLARALLAADPTACLWATDWPHTQTDGHIAPDELIAALYDWCPHEETRRTVLVEAPGRLFEGPDDRRRG